MSTAENPARPAFTDAEVKALARRLMSQVAWEWSDRLSWEDVPLLSEHDWARVVRALDREAKDLAGRADNADRNEDIDSIYLWEQVQ